MNQAPAPAPPAPQMLRLIWGAMMGSVLLYGIVTEIIIRAQPLGVSAETVGALRWAAAALSLVLLLIASWWRGSVIGALTDPMRMPEPDAAKRRTAAARMMTGAIAVWAMCEAVVILGMVVAVLAADLFEMIPFAAVGGGMLLIYRPNTWPTVVEPGTPASPP